MTTNRDRLMEELRVLDPAPGDAELAAMVNRTIDRATEATSSSATVGGRVAEAAQPREIRLVTLDRDLGPAPRWRVMPLAAACVALVVIIGGWLAARASSPVPAQQLAATVPPPADAPATGSTPPPPGPVTFGPRVFPEHQGYRLTPNVENEVSGPGRTVVVATVVAVGEPTRDVFAIEDAPPFTTEFALVTVEVREALAGMVAPGPRTAVRVNLTAAIGQIQVGPGSAVLLVLDGPRPPIDPDTGEYVLSSGFLVEGDAVLDPYGPPRPLAEVRELVRAGR